MALEIHAIIAHAKSVQDPAAAFKFAEVFQGRAGHLLGQAAKLAEDLQLQIFGQPRHFRGAGGSEDDLEWIHNARPAALAASLSKRAGKTILCVGPESVAGASNFLTPTIDIESLPDSLT